MRKFKVLTLALMLASMLLVMLAACGGGSKVDYDNLKIVIVTSGSSVDDGSFNQDNYEGIQDFIAAGSGAKVTAVTSDAISDSWRDVEAVFADYDIIVVPGFQFADISKLAIDNPEKYFILVDTNPTPIEGQEVFDNIYAMTFKEQESGFLAGIAAAMESDTNKVAFIGGMAYPSVINYQFGFYAGVRWADANLGTSTEIIELTPFFDDLGIVENVRGNYVGAFGDPVRGKQVAEALINEGVDRLFVAAGGSGLGAFNAAMESDGVMVIGCDVDQFGQGVYAGGNVVLTSALKNMRINVFRQLTAIKDGSFKGGNYLLGADTDSTGFVSAQGRHSLSPATVTAMNDAFARLQSGEIQPPGAFFAGNLG